MIEISKIIFRLQILDSISCELFKMFDRIHHRIGKNGLATDDKTRYAIIERRLSRKCEHHHDWGKHSSARICGGPQNMIGGGGLTCKMRKLANFSQHERSEMAFHEAARTSWRDYRVAHSLFFSRASDDGTHLKTIEKLRKCFDQGYITNLIIPRRIHEHIHLHVQDYLSRNTPRFEKLHFRHSDSSRIRKRSVEHSLPVKITPFISSFIPGLL